MKKMALFLMLLFSSAAYGETHYGDLLCDSMYWVYSGNYSDHFYQLEGSKVVNGKTYGLLRFLCLRIGSRGMGNSNFTQMSDTIGIRDEGGRVYVNLEDYMGLFTSNYYGWDRMVDSDYLPYETTEDGELVLYDFTKEVGDVYCRMADGTTLTVTKTSVITTEDGVTRRQLTLSNGFELIEGIGCTCSPGRMLFWLNTKPEYKDIGLLTFFGMKWADGTYTALLCQDFETIHVGITNKMLTQGRRWVYDYDNGQMKGTLTYYIDGDTLLQAYQRAKLCMTLVDSKTDKVVRSEYVGAFLERGVNMCYMAPGSNEEMVLYRFGLQGGSFRENNIRRYVVNTDDIVVNDITYHRFLLINYVGDSLPLDKDSLYYWVEGIGSSKGLLENWGGVPTDSTQFVACYDGETCIFTNDDFYKDSGQPIQFHTNLYKEPLWYYVDLSTKTASVSYTSDTCTSLGNIVILPSVELWGISCTVDKIDYGLFRNRTDLESITIPESVKVIESEAFYKCTGLTSVSLPSSLLTIGDAGFFGCTGLTSVILPEGFASIGRWAFQSCLNLKEVDIPASITSIDNYAFGQCEKLENVYCRAVTPPETKETRQFLKANPEVTLHVPAASLQVYKETAPWCNLKYIVPLEPEMAYRPFVEEDKVWKVGAVGSNPVQLVEYYYFDGDTIIGGKNCKQMMRQQYVSPDFPGYEIYSQQPSLSYVGAWYEEDKKVYTYDSIVNQFKLKYDFSVDANDTLLINNLPYVIGPRQMEGKDGFKGAYRDVMLCADGETIYSTPWLEGVGGLDRPTTNVYPGCVDPAWFLISCTVGDEVIYLIDGVEDAATPEAMLARNRFDFTHTIKTKPKAPIKREKSDAGISFFEREVARPKVKAPGRNADTGDAKASEELSIYGEYNAQQLSINLDPLDDAYLVHITNESGKTVYEKSVNAGNIVGLNIDISAYAKGSYTVTVENSIESFKGEFVTLTTGIEENVKTEKWNNGSIFNLQGQRISSLQKGLNIVNGQKIYVK